MTDWFLSGGIIMWPLLALALGVIAQAVRAAFELRRDPAADRRVLSLILFWGVMAVLVGALGTVVGVIIVASNVSAAGGATAGLIWSGVGVSLISLAAGILIFLLAAFLWLVLDAWRRHLGRRSGVIASTCLVLALAGSAAACGNTDAARFTATDSAGIWMAENIGPDRPLPTVPIRLASLQPPDSALTAVPWGVAADPDAGRIFVADGTSERVVVFDGDGRFLRTIGRAGDGPGEFRSPTAVALDPSGALAVWDARRGIISRWSTEGDLLDEQRAPVSYWGPGFAMRPDGVLAVTATTADSERRQALVEAGGAGEPTEIVALSRDLVALELPGMNMPAPRLFAPDLLWTAAGDSVLVLNGPGYRIDTYRNQTAVGSIRRDVGPITVTPEMAVARVQAGRFRGFMRRTGLTAEEIVAAIGYEEVMSPVQWLAVDPSGRLWVSRGSGGAVPDRVDILDADGRYLGTFDTPGLPVAFLSESTFIVLEVTDLGRPLLGLFRLQENG